jgi:hypothetical protein
MSPEDDALRVLENQRCQGEEIEATQAAQARTADTAIASTEALLRGLGVSLPSWRNEPAMRNGMTRAPRVRPWDEILADARHATIDRRTPITNVFSAEELHAASETEAALDEEFDSLHALDAFDWTVSGVAGTLGALIDILLVVVPRHPGFLGGNAEAGGWLSNLLKTGMGRLLPEDKIRELEKAYRVGYDASTSAGRRRDVPGGAQPAANSFHPRWSSHPPVA